MTALTKIGARGLIIIALLAVVALAQYARGLEPNFTLGTFTTGGIDLKIDSWAKYNGKVVPGATWALKELTPGVDKFFNFDDIKPGDFGCNVISMHVKKGEAWLCLDFKNYQNKDNGQNEPEFPLDEDGNARGELGNGIQFFGWIDNGDKAYKPGEKILFGTSTKSASTTINNKSYAVGDSKNGKSCKKDESRYVGMCWCAGTLTVNPSTGNMSCDGSTLGNAAQTDSLTVDVAIRAVETKDNSKFTCAPTSVAPPTIKKPIIKYFKADPSSIKKGKSSKLYWEVTGATTLSIDQGIGPVTGTSKYVSPNSTKTYTITATNAAGTVTATTKVTVNQSHWWWNN